MSNSGGAVFNRRCAMAMSESLSPWSAVWVCKSLGNKGSSGDHTLWSHIRPGMRMRGVGMGVTVAAD